MASFAATTSRAFADLDDLRRVQAVDNGGIGCGLVGDGGKFGGSVGWW